MKAMLIPVYGEPLEIELVEDANGSTLHAMQQAVGGNIEPFTPLFEDSPTLYVNDEGLSTCQPNRAIYATREMAQAGYLSQIDFFSHVEEGELYTILYGNIVAVGFDPETGDSCDITPEEMARVTDYFTEVSPAGTGIGEVMAIKAGRVYEGELPENIFKDPTYDTHPAEISLEEEVKTAREGSYALADDEVFKDDKDLDSNIPTNDDRQ